MCKKTFLKEISSIFLNEILKKERYWQELTYAPPPGRQDDKYPTPGQTRWQMPYPRADKMTNAPPPGRQDDKYPTPGQTRWQMPVGWARLECRLVCLLGALRNDDYDGSENITKKRNLHPFKLQRTLLSLFGIARFVKCRRLFLELNSQGLYPCSNRKGKTPETRPWFSFYVF